MTNRIDSNSFEEKISNSNKATEIINFEILESVSTDVSKNSNNRLKTKVKTST